MTIVHSRKWVQQFSNQEWLYLEGASVGAIAITIRLWDLHKIGAVAGTICIMGMLFLAGIATWLRFPRPPFRGCIFAALQGTALALAVGVAVHSMDPSRHSIAQFYSLSSLALIGYLPPGIFLSEYDVVVRQPAPFFCLLRWLRSKWEWLRRK